MVRKDDTAPRRRCKCVCWCISRYRGATLVLALCVQDGGEGLETAANSAFGREDVHEFAFEINVSVLQSQTLNLFSLV